MKAHFLYFVRPKSRQDSLETIRFVTTRLKAATQRLRNRIRRIGATRIVRSKMTAVAIGMSNYLLITHSPVLCPPTTRTRAIGVGSEEARLRASLRPPLKLHVQICCMQLSRRLSDAGMTEKELSRTTVQAGTRRKAWATTAASSQHCSNAYTDATKSVAGSSRRGDGRAYERGRVCNTRPNPAIMG